MLDFRETTADSADVRPEDVSPLLREVAHGARSKRGVTGKRGGVWRRARRELRIHWPRAAAAGELLLLVATVAFANAQAQDLGESPLTALPAILFVGVSWLGLWSLGLYQPHAQLAQHPARDCMRRVLFALAVGGLAALIAGGVSVIEALLTAFAVATLAMLTARQLLTHVLSKLALQRRIAFLGAGPRAATLFRQLRERDREPLLKSLKVLGFVPLASEGEGETAGLAPLLALSSLEALAREQELDEIVVVAGDRRSVLPMADLAACRVAGVRVLDDQTFHEREFGKVSLERLLPYWCVFTGAFDTSALRQLSQRGFDLSVLLVLLLLTWPLMLLVAAAILIESRGKGPLLYSQQRVGRHGKPFTLYKFRSMRTDAECDGVARFAQAGDTRVTSVGRVIRLLRLDELPQLWNVLRGEMSIVGPRPERPQFVEGFLERVPHYGLRHCVRPGLAGWAQLRFPYGASEADAVEKLGYDLYYTKFHSLRFDFAILLETAEVVVFGRGAR